ncbi:MAG: hypothetical protein IJS15_11490 [Victivallales bacterium]|nr:hypothetical protein [Victivallales bacterium]
MMRKRIHWMMLLGAILALGAFGCARYTPPLETSGDPIASSVSLYKPFVFDEEPARLRACMAMRSIGDGDFDYDYLSSLKKNLEANNVELITAPNEADLVFDIHTTLTEITPAPSCRLKQSIMMTVKGANGEALLNPWTHESVMPKGVSDANEARRMVSAESIRALAEWFRINYYEKTVADRSWSSAFFRVKTRRGLIHTDAHGEKVASKMLHDIKEIPGVIGAKLVEKDNNAMVFSYRVFYNKQKLKGPIKESFWKICRKY